MAGGVDPLVRYAVLGGLGYFGWQWASSQPSGTWARQAIDQARGWFQHPTVPGGGVTTAHAAAATAPVGPAQAPSGAQRTDVLYYVDSGHVIEKDTYSDGGVTFTDTGLTSAFPNGTASGDPNSLAVVPSGTGSTFQSQPVGATPYLKGDAFALHTDGLCWHEYYWSDGTTSYEQVESSVCGGAPSQTYAGPPNLAASYLQSTSLTDTGGQPLDWNNQQNQLVQDPNTGGSNAYGPGATVIGPDGTFYVWVVTGGQNYMQTPDGGLIGLEQFFH